MKVSEVKAKLPEAEIYELSPAFKYIMLINPDLVNPLVAKTIGNALHDEGIEVLIVFGTDLDNSMKLLEVGE